MKSTGVAYLLWFFLGWLGVHKFYLDKVGMGILYFFTFGLFGIGLFVDLFTLGSQVDAYNAMYMAKMNMLRPPSTTTVYTTAQAPSNINALQQLQELAALKEQGILTEEEFAEQKKRLLG